MTFIIVVLRLYVKKNPESSDPEFFYISKFSVVRQISVICLFS